MWTWGATYINQCVAGPRLLFVNICAWCGLPIFAAKFVGVMVRLRCMLAGVPPVQQGTIFAAKIVCSSAVCIYVEPQTALIAAQPLHPAAAPLGQSWRAGGQFGHDRGALGRGQA